MVSNAYVTDFHLNSYHCTFVSMYVLYFRFLCYLHQSACFVSVLHVIIPQFESLLFGGEPAAFSVGAILRLHGLVYLYQVCSPFSLEKMYVACILTYMQICVPGRVCPHELLGRHNKVDLLNHEESNQKISSSSMVNPLYNRISNQVFKVQLGSLFDIRWWAQCCLVIVIWISVLVTSQFLSTTITFHTLGKVIL